MWTLALGSFAGLVHALTGPDHLAGLAPLCARHPNRALGVGLRWGLGHSLGAALAALLALALRGLWPGAEQSISRWSELCVGLVLCSLGFLGLRAALHARRGAAAPPQAEPEHDPTHAAWGLGLLHGAAGLSHLFAVLPALALPGWLAPLLYLVGYALGSTAAMACFAKGLGRLSNRRELRQGVRLCSSAASLAVGLWWISEQLR